MGAHRSATGDSRASQRLGQTVGGKYLLRDVLGVGGMSTVYAASHRNGLAVAIKILHEELASGGDVRRWFLREAYLANRVNHRGAVRVLDDDVTEDGAAYLVIERLYGDTLRAVWERGGRKLPPRDVALFAYDVLDVLAAAHARGIIHRDIKPENLFLTDDGEVKVLDFGIAHPLPVVGDAAASTTLRVAGTPAYMAPEQARGSAVRAETDVWGMGATMFSLITGEYVHAGAPPPDLLTWAASRPARPVGELARDLPSELAAVIDRALAFEPEQRFATAHAMREALGEAFASAFRVTIGEARSAILAELRAREPAVGRGARGSEVHSVATRGPGGARDAAPRLEGPPTRTVTSGGAVTRTMALRVAPALGRIALLGALVALAALVVSQLFVSFSPLPRRQASTPAALRRFELDEISTVSGSTFPESAVSDFRAGVQLWRDASSLDAIRKLRRAATTAPDFALAHLWYVLASWEIAGPAREHYAAAVAHRSSLNELQRAVLDAVHPAVADPPDRVAAAERLADLVAQYSQEDDLPLLAANYYERVDNRERGAQVLQGLLARQPPPVRALYLSARLSSLTAALDDTPATTIELLKQCIDGSPTGTDCIYDLARIYTNEGLCQDIEPIARLAMAREPSAATPYDYLANALYSSGSPIEAVRAAYAKRAGMLRPESREYIVAGDDVALAIEEGRLSDAEHQAAAWTAAALRYDGTGTASSIPYELSVQLAMELGHREKALAIAHEFANQFASASTNENMDVVAEEILMRSWADDLSVSERAGLRDRILAASQDPAYGAPYRRWLNAYVGAAGSRDEALTAMTQMPTRPLPGPEYRGAGDDYALGHFFALAGQLPRARSFYSRAMHSCEVTEDFFRTKATLELALLSEERPMDACALYEQIHHHWAHSPESLSVTIATHKIALLSCHSTN